MTDPVVIAGTTIIGYLLQNYAPLLAIVPADRIKEGRLPEGVELPALVVTEVSQVERQPLKRGSKVRTDDRVSVTGRFVSVRQRKLVMQLVKDCCAGQVGTIAGASNVAIRTAGRGPDLNGPGNSFEKAQDFRVGYDA